MTVISIGEQTFDVDGVVFDKDGTLIELHVLWGTKGRVWLDWLLAQVIERFPTADVAGLETNLYQTIGVDKLSGEVVTQSPLAVAVFPKLFTAAAIVLYQHGVPWHDADALVTESVPLTIGALPTGDMIRPIGPVKEKCAELAAAGLKLAVATSDDHANAAATLPLLGIEHTIDLLVCADTPNVPNKPSAGVLRHIAAQWGTQPNRLLMVGDSVGDMHTGHNGGAAGSIGIAPSLDQEPELIAIADVVVTSIAEFLLI